MKKNEIVFSSFAEGDLYEIVNYYLDINPKFAKNIYKKIKEKILELGYFPLKGKIVPELEHQGILTYRQLIEGNYRIIYRKNENLIEVLIIIDARRDLENILIKKLSEISDEKE